MTDRDIAIEQIRYWRGLGWSAERAWMALTGTYSERNHALWRDCLAFMLGWLAKQGAP